MVFMFLFSVQAISATSVIHKGSHYGYASDIGDYKFTWKTYKYSKNNVKMKYRLYIYDYGFSIPGYVSLVKKNGKVKVTVYMKYGGKSSKSFKTSKTAVKYYYKIKPYYMF